MLKKKNQKTKELFKKKKENPKHSFLTKNTFSEDNKIISDFDNKAFKKKIHCLFLKSKKKVKVNLKV